jgi:hypothetical protein
METEMKVCTKKETIELSTVSQNMVTGTYLSNSYLENGREQNV